MRLPSGFFNMPSPGLFIMSAVGLLIIMAMVGVNLPRLQKHQSVIAVIAVIMATIQGTHIVVLGDAFDRAADHGWRLPESSAGYVLYGIATTVFMLVCTVVMFAKRYRVRGIVFASLTFLTASGAAWDVMYIVFTDSWALTFGILEIMAGFVLVAGLVVTGIMSASRSLRNRRNRPRQNEDILVRDAARVSAGGAVASV
jgi:hypothetical protein